MEVRPRQFEYKLTRERQVVARRWKIRLTHDLTVAVPADEVSKQRSAKRPAARDDAEAGIVNLTSCGRILGRSMEHDAFMLPSGRTSPGSKP
jgi:hypothetical protein